MPAWFPFAEFKRLAAQWQKRLFLGVNLPFDRMKANLVRYMLPHLQCVSYNHRKAAGVGKPSLTMSLLENPPSGCDEDVVKWLAGSLCKY